MKNVLLIAIYGLIAAGALAQSKPITENEYNATWRAATEKAKTLNRRCVQHIEIYRDGKLASTDEWQYEYLLPDRIHYVHLYTSGGNTIRTEEINVGKSVYCKYGDGSWKVPTGPCLGGTGGGQGNGISEEKFVVEDVLVDGKPLKRYQHYYTSRANYPEDPAKSGVYFGEDTFWLRDDGLITRQENRSGKLNPEIVQRRSTDTYEYEPKDLKIDAPPLNF